MNGARLARLSNPGVALAVGLALAVGGPMGLGGCASQRIALAEQFGYAKRSQLVDGVEKARDAQENAKQQFASALDEFMSVTGTTGGNLETKYRTLEKSLKRSEDRAAAVRSRIEHVDRVAAALFKEWEQELDQYASQALRDSSAAQLAQTRAQYDQLLRAMNAAASRMDPVLAAFRDQVLFLKHNLNAQAIASLRTTSAALESDIAALIREMEASIAEANAFITQMRLDR
jgi:mevalonate kinase